MAKKIDEKNLIHFEIEKLEAKVQEMQEYLTMNPIITSVTTGGEISLSEDSQDKLHKEILIQIKIQDALFNWLPLLEKLRAGEQAKEIATRGDVEINGLFKRSGSS